MKNINQAYMSYVYFARYARPDLGVTSWEQSVNRASNVIRQRIGLPHAKWSKVFNDYVESAKRQEVVPSMRLVQFLDACLSKNERVYNCCGMVTYPTIFEDVLYLTLCGVGCGINVSRKWVERLPSLKPLERPPATHTVEDSAEGWGRAAQALIDGFWRGQDTNFDFSNISPKGTILRSSGRPAPGPDPLRQSLDDVRALLLRKVKSHDYTLRPVDVFDIICILTRCVLAGGVRRAALLFAFDLEDEEMMLAKTGDWWKSHPHRAFANISAIVPPQEVRALQDKVRKLFHTAYEFGEPGVLFINDDMIVNPCAEIVFRPVIDGEPGFQFCNLTEIALHTAKDIKDLVNRAKAASAWGTVQTAFTTLKTRNEVAKRLITQEPLLGVSITGLYTADYDIRVDVFTTDVLRKMAHAVIQTNKELCKQLGIKEAVRHTCVKPSGTVSSLLGCSPGVHPCFARKFLRHAQEIKGSYMHNWYCKHIGEQYVVDVSNMYPNTVMMPFPIKFDNAITWRELPVRSVCSMIDIVTRDYIREGYTTSDFPNSVSFTFSVSREQVDDVVNWLIATESRPTGTTIFPNSVPEGFAALPQHPLVRKEEQDKWLELYSVLSSWESVPQPNWSSWVGRVETGCDGEICQVRG